MNLPEDTHLAYSVFHEAWYASVPGNVRQPEIGVAASAEGSGGGVAWEFAVEEVDLSPTAIRVRVFDDAFAAFAEMPEFFAALAAEKITTLAQVRELLDRLGAVDETSREQR